jgi:hypothetical protein
LRDLTAREQVDGGDVDQVLRADVELTAQFLGEAFAFHDELSCGLAYHNREAAWPGKDELARAIDDSNRASRFDEGGLSSPPRRPRG